MPNLAALAAFFSSMSEADVPNLSALDLAFSASDIIGDFDPTDLSGSPMAVVTAFFMPFELEIVPFAPGPVTKNKILTSLSTQN